MRAQPQRVATMRASRPRRSEPDAPLARFDEVEEVVDLGQRRHTSQSDEALGAMAGQVVSAVLARAAGGGIDGVSGLLTQFRHDGAGFVPHSTAVAVDERPPMVTVPEYRSQQAGLVG